MKTVIPCLNGKIAPDFQSANEYTLVGGSGYNLDLETMTPEAGTSVTALVDTLNQRGIQRVLAAGISDEAIRACEIAGLQVFHGAGGTLSDGLNLIRLGILDNMAKGGSGCGGGCGSGGCGGGCGSEEDSNCSSGSCDSGSCCG